MNASDPANSNKLTDEQLDALLESADQELLLHIQATTDPTVTLTTLLAHPVNLGDGQADPAHADRASERGHLTYGRRTRSHWQTVRVAAAVAVAAAAVATASIVAAHSVHHPTNPVSLLQLPRNPATVPPGPATVPPGPATIPSGTAAVSSGPATVSSGSATVPPRPAASLRDLWCNPGERRGHRVIIPGCVNAQ